MTATNPSQTSVPLKGGIIGLLLRFAAGLRFPVLFGLTAVVFLFDLVVPDFIPFVDEILLGLATLILANWRDRKPKRSGQPGSEEESLRD